MCIVGGMPDLMLIAADLDCSYPFACCYRLFIRPEHIVSFFHSIERYSGIKTALQFR